MAGGSIASLLIKIGADISSLETNVGKARATFEKGARDIETIGARMTSALTKAFTLGAAVEFGRELLDLADTTVRVSDRTGLMIAEVQKLSFVAGQSGNNLDELTTAIGAMQNRLAGGDKSAIKAIKDLGINLTDLQRAGPFQQIQLLAGGFGQLTSSTQAAGLSMDVFGKGGIAILPTLRSEFDKLAASATVASDASIKAFDAAGDALTRFNTTVKTAAIQSVGNWMLAGERIGQATAELIARLSGDMQKLADLQTIGRLDAAGQAASPAAIVPSLPPLLAYIQTLKDAQGPIRELSKAEQAQIDMAIRYGGTTKELAAAIGVNIGVIDRYVTSNKEAGAALQKHLDTIVALHGVLSGAASITAAQDMIAALKGLPPVLTLTEGAQRQVNQVMQAAVEGYVAAGQGASAAALAVEKLRNATVTLDLSKIANPFAGLERAKQVKARTDAVEILNANTPQLGDQGTTVGPTAIMDEWAAAAAAANQKIVESSAAAGTSITNNFVGAFRQASAAVDSMAAHIEAALGALEQTDAYVKAGLFVSEGFGAASRLAQEGLRAIGITRPGNVGAGAAVGLGGGGNVSITVNAPGAYGLDTPEGRRRLGEVAGGALLDAYKRAGGRG